jgi:hypothetical protein
MNVYETLRQAIIEKQPCRIVKSGQAERRVCPYRLGRSKDGEQSLLYYQYEGFSLRGLEADGSERNWRCNKVFDIASAEIVEEPWKQPAKKPKTRGPCVVSLDVEIAGYY